MRIEARLAQDEKRTYPYCIGGKRRALPEECGGPLAFIVRRDTLSLYVADLLEVIQDDWAAGDFGAVRDRSEDLEALQEWLGLDEFDRRALNRRLRQYTAHDEAWRC